MEQSNLIKPNGLSMEVSVNEFALELKTWRLRQGLLQREVAERWGMSRYTIMRAERGQKISWMIAYRIFAKLSEELRLENKAREQ